MFKHSYQTTPITDNEVVPAKRQRRETSPKILPLEYVLCHHITSTGRFKLKFGQSDARMFPEIAVSFIIIESGVWVTLKLWIHQNWHKAHPALIVNLRDVVSAQANLETSVAPLLTINFYSFGGTLDGIPHLFPVLNEHLFGEKAIKQTDGTLYPMRQLFAEAYETTKKGFLESPLSKIRKPPDHLIRHPSVCVELGALWFNCEANSDVPVIGLEYKSGNTVHLTLIVNTTVENYHAFFDCLGNAGVVFKNTAPTVVTRGRYTVHLQADVFEQTVIPALNQHFFKTLVEWDFISKITTSLSQLFEQAYQKAKQSYQPEIPDLAPACSL